MVENSDPYRRFIRLPKILVQSEVWRKLTCRARAAYIELAYIYNGHNNGRIYCASRYLGLKLRCSKTTAARALRELCNAKLVEVTEQGVFTRGDRLASQYRLMLYPCDETGKVAEPPFKIPPPTEKS